MKMKHELKPLALSGWVLLVLALPAAGGGMMHGRGMMGGSMARHHYYMRHGLPSAYAGKTNPLPATAANIEAGRTLYARHCAACHGASGRGNGPAGRDLDPPPADLARAGRMRMMADAYFYWAIAEGGAQFRTAMPAWKGSLQESEIWQLVLYLRGL